MLNIFPYNFSHPLHMRSYAYVLAPYSCTSVFSACAIAQHPGKPRSYFSSRGFFYTWCMGMTEIVTGTLFLFGFLTQIAALFAMVLSLTMIVFLSSLYPTSCTRENFLSAPPHDFTLTLHYGSRYTRIRSPHLVDNTFDCGIVSVHKNKGFYARK